MWEKYPGLVSKKNHTRDRQRAALKEKGGVAKVISRGNPN